MGHYAGEPGMPAWGDSVDASIAAHTSSIATSLQPVVNLAQYGVVPSATASVNTAGLAAAAASGYTNFFLPAGTYQVAVPLGGSLMAFTGQNHIRVRGDNAVLNDVTTHSNNGAFSDVFMFNGCADVEVSGIEYVGQVLSSPSTLLGYQGAVFVHAINGTDGVRVNARLTNLRYGVLTGEYGDPTKGNCRNFYITIRGFMIGYSIAAYYASGIRHDIDSDGVHRVAYIAGCDDVTGVARWSNQYIADTAYLITDALTSGTDAAAQADPVGSPTTSRGCSNMDVTSIDKGSTVFQTSSRCAGINLSRVDPCTFKNIRVRVSSTGTDTVSTQVGAWVMASGAKSVWSRYAYNFEPTTVFDNITVSGVIDHSAATSAGNSGSEFYVLAYDGTAAHAATIRGFTVDGLTILPSSATSPRSSWFAATGLSTPAVFRHFNTPGLGLVLLTNSTVETVFDRCNLAVLDVSSVTGGSRTVVGPGTKLTGQTCNVAITNTTAAGGTIGGAGPVIRQREVTLTLSGASTMWTAAIPSGSIPLSMHGRVQAAITGASGYTVGVSGDTTRFANQTALTVGSTFSPTGSTEVNPRRYPATTDVVVTAVTSNFTGGVLRLVLSYIDFTTPNA